MRTLTRRDFASFVHSRPVAVIHVDAAWNTYRDAFREKMLAAQARLKEFVAFAEVDSDSQPELCKSLHVANVPQVAYFREGRLAATVVGADQDVFALTQELLNGNVPTRRS
jgi:thioredoxin-like negative regulator of GroEL